MRQRVLLDAGPLVALLDRRDRFHSWVTGEWANIAPPLLTCEAVITEACFLLRNVYAGKQAVISLVNTGVIQIPFRLSEESASIAELLTRYQSVPMSLADACLVRMAELYSGSLLFTLDSDFRIYRKNRNEMIAVIMPEDV
ncbi:type II toxin-antitoxin system VapC family toxin [Kamptonema formosum]|uniref:type II toxin-antitoxin system VapC family toxin n=1 Tax=Kamptonema formosum TaxID=331992 RepID=UPI000376F464|nr:PIN domain-containing protein [Oscillatoria sp. PCC 10802]